MEKQKSPREASLQGAPVSLAAKKETGFASSYIEFAKTLRTWFVAYGIGAPVLVLSQDALRTALKASPYAQTIAWCFLLGVCLQILAALTYKVAMWYLYMGELDETFCNDWRYKLSDKISFALWLELMFDLGTLGMFGVATFRMLTVFST